MVGIELAIACGCGAVVAGRRRVGAISRRRWMTRQAAPTFVFADLVGYTALSDARGDDVAALVAAQFRETIAALSREHGAWHVKSMGDGAMIWAPDAATAVSFAARTLAEVGTHPHLLPVRIGAHTGPAILHDGDWYGRAVNLAARLAREAEPGEALVSSATVAAARADLRHALSARGELTLRGIAQPVGVWRLTADGPRWRGPRVCAAG